MQNPNKIPTYKARIRFEKTGNMRWVGHLDLMRFFQKAIKRSGLPIAYSQGFHPHQLLSFALPLGIGLTSEGEYVDLELAWRMDPREAVSRLNEQMAAGMRICSLAYQPEKSKKAMAIVAAARYYVYLVLSDAQADADVDLEEGIRRFYRDSQSITIEKTTKKGVRTLDLKPLVYAFDPCRQEDAIPAGLSGEGSPGRGFLVTLSAGSVDNIKPELLFLRFMKYLGFGEEDYRLRIHRIDLLRRDEEGRLVSLEENRPGE